MTEIIYIILGLLLYLAFFKIFTSVIGPATIVYSIKNNNIFILMFLGIFEGLLASILDFGFILVTFYTYYIWREYSKKSKMISFEDDFLSIYKKGTILRIIALTIIFFLYSAKSY